MRIGEVHLLAEPIAAKLLVELRSQAGIKRSRVLIKRGFEKRESVRCTHRKLEVEIAAFQDALRGNEKEVAIFDQWATELTIRIPAQHEGRLCLSGNVTGIQVVIAVEQRNG